MDSAASPAARLQPPTGAAAFGARVKQEDRQRTLAGSLGAVRHSRDRLCESPGAAASAEGRIRAARNSAGNETGIGDEGDDSQRGDETAGKARKGSVADLPRGQDGKGERTEWADDAGALSRCQDGKESKETESTKEQGGRADEDAERESAPHGDCLKGRSRTGFDSLGCVLGFSGSSGASEAQTMDEVSLEGRGAGHETRGVDRSSATQTGDIHRERKKQSSTVRSQLTDGFRPAGIFPASRERFASFRTKLARGERDEGRVEVRGREKRKEGGVTGREAGAPLPGAADEDAKEAEGRQSSADVTRAATNPTAERLAAETEQREAADEGELEKEERGTARSEEATRCCSRSRSNGRESASGDACGGAEDARQERKPERPEEKGRRGETKRGTNRASRLRSSSSPSPRNSGTVERHDVGRAVDSRGENGGLCAGRRPSLGENAKAAPRSQRSNPRRACREGRGLTPCGVEWTRELIAVAKEQAAQIAWSTDDSPSLRRLLTVVPEAKPGVGRGLFLQGDLPGCLCSLWLETLREYAARRRRKRKKGAGSDGEAEGGRRRRPRAVETAERLGAEAETRRSEGGRDERGTEESVRRKGLQVERRRQGGTGGREGPLVRSGGGDRRPPTHGERLQRRKRRGTRGRELGERPEEERDAAEQVEARGENKATERRDDAGDRHESEACQAGWNVDLRGLVENEGSAKHGPTPHLSAATGGIRAEKDGERGEAGKVKKGEIEGDTCGSSEAERPKRSTDPPVQDKDGVGAHRGPERSVARRGKGSKAEIWERKEAEPTRKETRSKGSVVLPCGCGEDGERGGFRLLCFRGDVVLSAYNDCRKKAFSALAPLCAAEADFIYSPEENPGIEPASHLSPAFTLASLDIPFSFQLQANNYLNSELVEEVKAIFGNHYCARHCHGFFDINQDNIPCIVTRPGRRLSRGPFGVFYGWRGMRSFPCAHVGCTHVCSRTCSCYEEEALWRTCWRKHQRLPVPETPQDAERQQRGERERGRKCERTEGKNKRL
uniref:Uncharacterized protein n=1 Tax=Neospora caninum (strain Liverpool) TaxID=572307 RepID=A0A0F7UGF8_NEOCL|nr:TPA: hypothetical protein BN1204_046910 [Neospora caninum Liverpool]